MVDLWGLDFVTAKGRTIEEMRQNAEASGLYQHGDMRLIWVNETVLEMMMLAGQANNLDSE